MIFFSDMHIHSFASVCCQDERQTPENIVPLLAGKGYKKIGFTDHVWISKDVEPSHFYKTQNGERHLELFDFIRSCRWEIEVLVGCETDMIAPGVFGITPEFKEKMDYVVMATDHFHMTNFVQLPEEETPECLARHMLKFFISAAKSGIPDILVHPFFPYGYVELYDKSIASLPDAELLDAFSIAASNNIGIEINKCYLPKPQLDRCFSLETPMRILTLAKQAGCTFTIGSDAHNIESFDVLDKLQSLAESLDLSEKNIHPLAKIRKLKKVKKS
ncbi:MAG: PHP domain-containing protein [Victivallaceae bacterium]|nr:PHP domain-containing protein [Victivallaceae bacterium]